MGRMAGVLLAGGLLAMAGGGGAHADAPTQAVAARAVVVKAPRTAALHAVVGRAHLVFKPAADQPTLEGDVTVIQARPADWNSAAVGVLMTPCPDPPEPASPPPARPGLPSAS